MLSQPLECPNKPKKHECASHLRYTSVWPAPSMLSLLVRLVRARRQREIGSAWVPQEVRSMVPARPQHPTPSAIDFGQFRLRPAFFFEFGQFDFGQFRLRPISTSANFWMLNFGTTKGGPPKGGGPEGGGPNPEKVGPRKVGPEGVEAPKGGGPEGWRPKPRKSGETKGGPRRLGPEGWRPRRVEAPKGGGPEGWGPKISRFFFPFSRHNFLLLSLSWGPFVNFGGV